VTGRDIEVVSRKYMSDGEIAIKNVDGRIKRMVGKEVTQLQPNHHAIAISCGYPAARLLSLHLNPERGNSA